MPIRSRPVPTNGAPWRTAPGRGSDGAAAPAPQPGSPAPDRYTDLHTHRDVDDHHGPAPTRLRPSTPHQAPDQTSTASPTDSPVRDSSQNTAPAPVEPVAEDVAVEEQPAATESSHRHAPESEPEPEPADELARPQVRLNADLPRAKPSPRAARGAGTTAVVRRSAGEEFFSRSVRSLEPISDLEAASFAGRFATDFQSFDEDVPSRRAEVLRPLLADPQASTWGWSGAGRQRADSPLPGRIYRPGDTVVFVEVIVRVTTYARACPPPEAPRPAGSAEVELSGLLGPSCAPPEADPAWTAVEANWVRMTVPITRDDGGHLVVDPHLRPTDSS